MSDIFEFDKITPERIKAEAKREIREQLDPQGLSVETREGSYTDILLSAGAYQVYKAYMLAQSLMERAVPGPDGGEALDAFASVFGIYRTDGIRAMMLAEFSGTDGTAVPQGTWVVTPEGLRYATVTAATILDGTAQVYAQAEYPGSHYNVAVGTLLRTQTALPGVTAVTCMGASSGTDVESDRAFYDRIVLTLSTPSNGGNAASYQKWALECDGVAYAAPVPLWSGPGTVKVIIAGADKIPVTEPVRADVADHIERVRPVGAAVTVTTVEVLEISVAAVIVLDETADLLTVTEALKTELEEMFSAVQIGDPEPVRYNRVLAKLLETPGVVDYQSLTVNGGTDNVMLTQEQVPKLGAVTITAG